MVILHRGSRARDDRDADLAEHMSSDQGLTSQAPLTKFAWSTTYIGSVSQRQLVLFTLMPRADISLQAFSIHPILSPRLLPSAMYAVRLVDPFFKAFGNDDGLW